MKKKLISALLLTGMLMLTCTGCGNQNTELPDSEPEREIDVCLDAYEVAGGLLSVTETGGVSEYGSIGLLAAQGETIGDALTFSGYSAIEPVLEGDVFEGWMEYTAVTSVDEDGFENCAYEIVSEELYTTEQLLEMTVPDHAVNYVAKWAGIPAEDYFTADAWDDGFSSGSFSFSANGGSMSFHESDGTIYDSAFYTYWLEDGQALNDIMGTEYGAALISVEKEGSEFAGWTLYEADSAFWNSESVEDEGITSFLYDTEHEDTRYLLLKNAAVIREAASTEELCGLSIEGKSYYAEANWN